MNVIWCDTETTGLKPENSGAFEIAFIVACNGAVLAEQVYHLNPLNETILYGEEAAKTHGISEETIRSYETAEKVIPVIDSFLCEAMEKYCNGEKMVFAGYNCSFDWQHVQALFTRYGYNLRDYFLRQVDVMQLVKKAVNKKLVSRFANLKLTTVCKALGIELQDAHTALADITATRNLCIELYKKGVRI